MYGGSIYVLVTYDVSTETPAGRRRLRRVASICKDYGIRVQNSVFELLVDPAQWAECRGKLEREADRVEDSLRYYFLGKNWRRRVDSFGKTSGPDMESPLIV